MPLIFRDTKGAPLTAAEVDANFRFVQDEIEDIQENPPVANSISNVTVGGGGGTFSVHLEDGTIFGPFNLPTAMVTWRGEWIPDTGYFYLDLVYTLTGGVYLVLIDHVSADEFDPDAEITEGTLYHHIWGPVTATQSPVVVVSDPVFAPAPSQAGSFFRCLSECTVVISSLGMDVSMEFHFLQEGSGTVTFDCDTNDEFVPYPGHLFETGGQGRVVTVKHLGSGVFSVFGGLAEDVTA